MSQTKVPPDIHIHWSFTKPNIKVAKPQLYDDSTNVFYVIAENENDDQLDPEETISTMMLIERLRKLLHLMVKEYKISVF